MFLLGRPYEPCKSCATLREQLAMANSMIQFQADRNRELIESVTALIQPKVVTPVDMKELRPIGRSAAPFSIRRQAMEQRDRQTAKVVNESPYLARPDSGTPESTKVAELEKELGVDDVGGNAS